MQRCGWQWIGFVLCVIRSCTISDLPKICGICCVFMRSPQHFTINRRGTPPPPRAQLSPFSRFLRLFCPLSYSFNQQFSAVDIVNSGHSVGMYSISVYLYSGASKTFVRGAWERDHASPSSRTSSPLQKHSLFGATSMPRGTEPSRPLKTLKFFVRSQRVQGACDEVEFCRFCQRHTFSRPPPPFVVFRKAGVHHASFVDDEGGGPSE